MKRLISFILLCSLLMACLVGCAISNNGENGQSSESENKTGEETPKETEDKYKDWELIDYLNQIEADTAENAKIDFLLSQTNRYYEIKNAVPYDESKWGNYHFWALVKLDYEKAVNEDWSKQVATDDRKALDEAFYDHCKSDLNYGEKTNFYKQGGLELSYNTAEDLFGDYSVLKALVDLGYITNVRILFAFNQSSESGKEDDKKDKYNVEDREILHNCFDIIRADAEEISKLTFSVTGEEKHYTLKDSGRFDNSEWFKSYFTVKIRCMYSKATGEDWYKQATQTDSLSLSKAFYDHCSQGLKSGEPQFFMAPAGMDITYANTEDMLTDYQTIKALLDLDYVTGISISFSFGTPKDLYVLTPG